MPSQLTVMERPLVTGSGGKKVNNQCSKSKIRLMDIEFCFVVCALTNFPNTIKDDVDCTLCEREGRREGEREIILSVSVP